MDYILWLILLFVGAFAQCLGIALAGAIAYLLFLWIYDNNSKIQEKLEIKGDK